jgi:hypothetical protein
MLIGAVLLSYKFDHDSVIVPQMENTGNIGDKTFYTIEAILLGDKKECRLIDHWTEAPIVMLHYAKVFKIDPYLLPCISRVEGPTKTMLDSSNIYGFEIRGKYLNMGNFDYATEAAAALLEMYKPRYQANGLVNIDTLAAIWCPISKELWAKNMKEIYLKALRN